VTHPKIAPPMGAPKYKFECSKIPSTGWGQSLVDKMVDKPHQ